MRTLSCGLLAGTAIAAVTPLDAPSFACLALVLGTGLSLWLGRCTRAGLHALLLGAAAAAGSLHGAGRLPPPVPVAFGADVAALDAVVTHGPWRSAARLAGDGSGELLFEARPAPAPGRSAPGRVLVRVRGIEHDVRLLPGDAVRVVGRVAGIRAPSNPGQRDRRTGLRRRGVTADVVVAAPEALSHRDGVGGARGAAVLLRRSGERLRGAAIARIRAACGDRPRVAALLSCLLVGDRRMLDPAVRDAFRGAGVAHLLAVSGLHVVLLVTALSFVGARFTPPRVRERLGPWPLLVLLLAYCAACRLAVPVVRASVFLAVARVAGGAGRRSSALDHLAAAAALVAMTDPLQIVSVGFLLSFAAVAGLALLTPRFEEALFPQLDILLRFPEALPRWRLRAFTTLARALSASLAAQTATAPIVAAAFGELHPAGALTNLVAIPLVAVSLPLAAALVATGPWLAAITGPLAALPAHLLVGAVTLLSGMPGATIGRGPPASWAVAGAIGVLVFGATRRRWGRVHLMLPLFAWSLLALAPASRPAADGPHAVVLDVGHGLAVLVRDGRGGDVLFDAGGRAPAMAERVIVPALRRMGVRRLAALFLSHEDADHCGAAPAVLDAFDVGCVVVPAGFGGDPAARAVLDRCRRLAVPVRRFGRGDTFAAADLEVSALHPRTDAVGPAGNPGSLVVLARVGALRLLLPGDLEGPGLDALAEDRTLPGADVLLLPHHGRGEPDVHLRLAERIGARVLVASTSASAPTAVAGALTTGRDGAVLLLPDEPPRTFPW